MEPFAGLAPRRCRGRSFALLLGSPEARDERSAHADASCPALRGGGLPGDGRLWGASRRDHHDGAAVLALASVRDVLRVVVRKCRPGRSSFSSDAASVRALDRSETHR